MAKEHATIGVHVTLVPHGFQLDFEIEKGMTGSFCFDFPTSYKDCDALAKEVVNDFVQVLRGKGRIGG